MNKIYRMGRAICSLSILFIIIPTWVFISSIIYFPADAGIAPPPTLSSLQISAPEAVAWFGIVYLCGKDGGGDVIKDI